MDFREPKIRSHIHHNEDHQKIEEKSTRIFTGEKRILKSIHVRDIWRERKDPTKNLI